MAVRRFTLVALLCMSWVQVWVGAEPTCSVANTSAIGVYFDSQQNGTGDWQHSIVLSKRGLQKGYTLQRDDIPWKVDVDYQPVYCDTDLKDSLNVKISFSLHRIRNPDYKFYPGLGYYKFHATLDTWAVAKANCEKEGAHLVIVNSQEEADLMKVLNVNNTGVWCWVGLIKNDAKGEFTTVFGVPASATGFSKWHSGVNPANAAATHAAVIHKTDATFSYDSNAAKYVSVCEQDL